MWLEYNGKRVGKPLIKPLITDPEKVIVELSIAQYCSDTHANTYRHGQITRKEAVLEDASIGNVDALALVRHDNHRPTQRHVSPKVNVSGHRQVIQLDNLRDLLEPLLELLDLQKSSSQNLPNEQLWRGCAAHLLEVVAKLDHRRVLEHPFRIDHQLSVFQRIDIALDQ